MKFIQINEQATIAPIQKEKPKASSFYEQYYESLLNVVKIIYNKSLTIEEITELCKISNNKARQYMLKLRACGLLISEKQAAKGICKHTCLVDHVERELFYRRFFALNESKIAKIMQDVSIGKYYTMESKTLNAKYQEQAKLQTKEAKKKIVASNMQSSFSIIS